MKSRKPKLAGGYTKDFKRNLMERSLAMRAQAYQAQIKAQLLTEAIIQIENSKKSLRSLNDNLANEIATRKQAEERIQYLASHDVLTGLPSRLLLRDRLEIAIKTAERNQAKLAILFIDLDGFKAVNDNFGHKAGDSLLEEIATRLKAVVRQSDTVARIGGDEFIVLSNGIHSDADAATVAGKILASIGQPVSLGEQYATVGGSIGISIFPDHGNDIEKLIAYADAAMYDIKKTGKNAYAFYQTLNE